MPLPKLYCDMDGVLADFKKGAERVTGVPINQWMNLTKQEKWNPIRTVSYTHLTLPTNREV